MPHNAMRSVYNEDCQTCTYAWCCGRCYCCKPEPRPSSVLHNVLSRVDEHTTWAEFNEMLRHDRTT